MVRITLEGVGKTPAAQTLDEHWRDIRKSLWKQVLRQEKNSSRVFYNGNHLLSPSGANIVFRYENYSFPKSCYSIIKMIIPV